MKKYYWRRREMRAMGTIRRVKLVFMVLPAFARRAGGTELDSTIMTGDEDVALLVEYTGSTLLLVVVVAQGTVVV